MAQLKGGTYVGGDLVVATDLYANTLKVSAATGVAPMIINSTTMVTNLNVDYLDGQHGAYYQPASTAITTSNIGSQNVSYANNANYAVTAGTCSGNAATATILQTARTIAGVSFDGSANISLNNNAITNGAGYTTNTGTVTSITAGTGLSGGTISTSGTIAVNYGSTSTTSCVGNDSRLSDVRTPTDASVTYGKVATSLTTSATVTSTVDLSAGGIGFITLSANTAFTFTNFQLNKSYLLVITANGYTPSWAAGTKHIAIDGNAVFATSGVFYVNLTCIVSTSGSEKLLTTIMKGA